MGIPTPPVVLPNPVLEHLDPPVTEEEMQALAVRRSMRAALGLRAPTSVAEFRAENLAEEIADRGGAAARA